MSSFIQIPSNLVNLSTRSKFKELYAYLLIRNQIKDNSYKASIPEEELASLLDTTKRTVVTYIADLKPYFENITLVKDKGKYPYNVYHSVRLDKDYSIVLPEIIKDTDLTAEQKGILIKIKLICEKGTNFIKFGTKKELAKLIGISKNQFTAKLKPLLDKGYLRYINDSLHLNPTYFPLSLKMDDSYSGFLNQIYLVIYQFCFDKNVCPPLKDNKALSYLTGKYMKVDDLIKDIKYRCNNLPEDISLDYFVKALENKKIVRENEEDKLELDFLKINNEGYF